MAICNKQHRFDNKQFDDLPAGQDNQYGGRHICAGCAYEAGVRDGMDGKPKQTDLSHLPESQAGAVRHKNAYEAYKLGYAEGRRISS